MGWESLQIASDDVSDDHEIANGDANGTNGTNGTHSDAHDVEKAAPVVPVTKAKPWSGDSSHSSSSSGFGTLATVLLLFAVLFLVGVLSANLYYTIDVDHLVRNRLPASGSSVSSSLATLKCDVAVIGGGPGGVYTAMRLQQSSATLKVCLFEAMTEVGGRLKTRWFDGAPTSQLDLGGMRFYQRHRLVWNMVNQYAMPYYSPVSGPNTYSFLRNTRVTGDMWSKGTAPYFFTPAEQAILNASAGSGPSTLSSPIMQNLGLDKASTATWTNCDWNNWAANAVYGPANAPVWNQGWWYNLQQIMSDEAVDAVRDAYGYDSSVSESNLADHVRHSLPTVNDSDITSYAELRPSQGYQTLVKNMWNSFTQAGGVTYLNSMLVANNPAPGGGSLLTFTGSAPATLAAQTIYALPKGAIQSLQNPGMSLSTATIQAALNGVEAIPAFKIFLAFPSAWWTQLGITGGMMALTSPIRKMYYWNVEPGTGNAIILAGYEDSASAAYMADILEQYTPLVPIYFSQAPGMSAAHTFVQLNSSDELAMVTRDVLREVRTAHPTISIPDPYAAVFQDWSRPPFYGGWHSWSVGYQSQPIRQALRQPVAEPTYVCGEAYSDDQGWVEGALRSCEKLLIDQFNLPSQWSTYLQCT